MNLDTMRLFREVVASRSFSQGARAAGVSQSAASQAVAHLESELGVVLIDRSQRPFALTAEGRKCCDGFQKVLEEYDRVRAAVRVTHAQIAGTVRVAAIYSVGIHEMSRHIQRFMSLYPQARVRLQYLRPDMVVDAVASENVDLGVLSFPKPSRSLGTTLLREEKMVFVCHPTHSLAIRKGIEARDLEGREFVAFDRDLAIRRSIDKALRRRKVSVSIVLEFDNIENIKQALESGAGISILPEPAVRREAEHGILVALPLAIPELVRPIGILHRRRKLLSPVVAKFIEILKSGDKE